MAMRIVEPIVLVLSPFAFVRARGRRVRTRAIDDFVQTAAIDPDAAAAWTVVDLDALALGHFEFDIAGWAIHTHRTLQLQCR
jgi:hypothetical protein